MREQTIQQLQTIIDNCNDLMMILDGGTADEHLLPMDETEISTALRYIADIRQNVYHVADQFLPF